MATVQNLKSDFQGRCMKICFLAVHLGPRRLVSNTCLGGHGISGPIFRGIFGGISQGIEAISEQHKGIKPQFHQNTCRYILVV